MIRPTLQVVLESLAAAEAFGRAAVDLWIRLPPDAVVKDHAGGRGGHGYRRDEYVAGEVTVPADVDEIAALGRRFEREFARAFGMPRWEGASEQ